MTSLLLVLSLPAWSATLEVGSGQPYSTVADAVAAAASGDVVRIHPGTYTGDLTLTSVQLTLEGTGAPEDVVLVSTSGDSGFLRVRQGADITVRGLTLDGGGAARVTLVEQTGILTLRNVVVRDGDRTDGGCVHVHGDATLVVEDSRFADCTTTGKGGAIYLHNSAQATVTDSLFEANTAEVGGAAMCENDTLCTFAGDLFHGNSAQAEGGALSMSTTLPVDLSGSFFVENTAVGTGGAYHIDGPSIVTDNVFCENHSDLEGGALYVNVQSDVLNNHFLGNTSVGIGAALRSLDRTVFTNNLVAFNAGSAGAVAGGAAVELSYSWFYDNTVIDEDVPLGTANTYGQDPQLSDYLPGDCLGSDVTLEPSSGLIDGGDPDPAYDDPDGTPSDIGAYQPDVGNPGPKGEDTDGDGVPDDDDCAPADPTVYPGADEVPGDGVDQDCSGNDDCLVDGDGDGFGRGLAPATTADCSGPGETTVDGDCDDRRLDVNPDAPEVCDPDDIDEDCDGAADDLDDDAVGQVQLYGDGDGDGYGDLGTKPVDAACDPAPDAVRTNDDCDDARPDVNPGAQEVCDPNDVDEDCNGAADNDDPEAVGAVLQPVDRDGDGYVGPDEQLACDPVLDPQPGEDCDDLRADVNPGAQEVCDPDDVDEDCNGVADDDDPGAGGVQAYAIDDDGDGYAGEDTVLACDPPPNAEETLGDCADGNPDRSPGTPEIAGDGIDQNCTGADLELAWGSYGGCGCTAQGGATGAWAGLVLAAVALGRRRR